MSRLTTILSNKKKSIIDSKQYSISLLEKSPIFNRRVISLKKNIKRLNSIGLIAEFKLSSPYKKIRNKIYSINYITKKYDITGISGISIITDNRYFLGKIDNVLITRLNRPLIPLLRKDFIIDEYQIIASKAFGADVILLITEIISKEKIKIISSLAKKLSLEIILELNSINEINKINDCIDFIGVNNRNLKNFYVNVNNSVKLINYIKKKHILLSESGINNGQIIELLNKIGVRGFLIGEYLINEKNKNMWY
jgi:indole-3-glycerol phosphate synthase